ncbi:MAG: septal ring lytic transglycosylase RlpA family protein [Gammaproteobacteria bacterium]|nr:septal ring lytic transglycosylase RlpA family protein [Gammaproteobacteria bacterium]
MQIHYWLSLLVICSAITGCGTPMPMVSDSGAVYSPRSMDGPGVVSLAESAQPMVVKNLPKSRIGNRSTYTVFGQQYRVMESAKGFSERGIASWYGSKFHGRDTSSGERYDMYQMTAAHKHLPLPTFVKVTHLNTGKSIVVKVNDRGPFVGDRIIDLSYAAAHKLGVLDTGTAPVEIVALSSHEPDTLVQNSAAKRALPISKEEVESASIHKSNTVVAQTPLASAQPTHYIQIGAFRHQQNAESLKLKVVDSLPLPTRIQHDVERELFRVRVGPVKNQSVLQETLSALAAVGIDQYRFIRIDN